MQNQEQLAISNHGALAPGPFAQSPGNGSRQLPINRHSHSVRINGHTIELSRQGELKLQTAATLKEGAPDGWKEALDKRLTSAATT
jgi:hypothetical protein